MPNWCRNRLYVGDSEGSPILENMEQLLSEFITKSEKHENMRFIDFEKLLPTPEALCVPDCPGPEDEELLRRYRENEEKYGSVGWYMWRVKHWGTKWNADVFFTSEDGAELEFDTAWSPPMPAIKELAKRIALNGRCLVLEYVEEGMCFCGKYIVGVDTEKDHRYSFDSAPPDFLESFGVDLEQYLT